MNLRLTSLLAAFLMLAACSQQQAPQPASVVAAPAATTATPAPIEAATAAVATSAASTTTPTAAQPEVPNDNPVVPPQGAPPVAGTDYEEIAGGQPYQPLDGRIEVVEVFGYVCPACASFHPVVSDWEKKLPADVRFTYVPAPFGPEWNPYAKSYYVAESMGLVERTHDALINAIHVQHTMPGEGDKPDEQKIADFYAGHGANPSQFLAAMNSFAVASKIARGKQFMVRSGVSSTPTLVVNGKYRITGGRGWQDKVRIADHLIAMERAAGATGG